MLITLARKPLTGSVVQNALQHGCGALNVDATRVGTEGTKRKNNARTNSTGWGMGKFTHISGSDAGRWPANVLHDGSDAVLAGFRQGRSAGMYPSASVHRNGVTSFSGRQEPLYADSGSAARFFKQVQRQPDGFPSQDKQIQGQPDGLPSQDKQVGQ